MHKTVIATLSALALMTGAAAAQTGTGGSAQAPSSQAPNSVIMDQGQSARPAGSTSNAMGGASVEHLMSRTVIGADGEKVGKVSDVILGPDGNAQLLVIQSGGFLGIGGKEIAADIALADVLPGNGPITLRDVTQASVRDMPEFQYSDSMTSLNRGPKHSGESNKQ
ncbi:PRC-barrel domain containing protein [Azospirillum brasilense]|uniref:PRC-barrel domain containing protein n=1 Tax=Azospirillum brasilense TaxID=192 RepID=A0A4D8R4M0_AZOBR|nr:PRC-barrel domain-containing protein [Azospirillum brasilense]QCO15713.1 PRC-barrel domain containing protein [Azospirillum brasilense]